MLEHIFEQSNHSFSWQFGTQDSADIANGKLAFILLRLIGKYGQKISELHNSSEIITLLMPTLLECKTELAKCAKLKNKIKKATPDFDIDIDIDVENGNESDWSSRAGQRKLQREILKNLPAMPYQNLITAAAKKLQPWLASVNDGSTQTLQLLQAALGLNQFELAFLDVALAKARSGTSEDYFGFLNSSAYIRSAFICLGLMPPSHIYWPLDTRSKLMKSGLLEVGSSNRCDFGDMLQLSKMGHRLLMDSHDSVESMAKTVLEPFSSIDAKNSSGNQLAWPHLDMQTAYLKSVLTLAIEKKSTGINILLHGIPGTGKTEYARTLCQDLALSAYSVTSKDEEGDEATRNERLTNLRLCQQLAGDNQKSILVLDEAEDIFRSGYNNPFAEFFGTTSSRSESKAWINDLLESNRHPVIWISNRINHLDPAYLRRFAYVLEFRTPPRHQRLVMAEQHLKPVGASPAMLEKLSFNAGLTPAMLSSAARFVSLAQIDASQGPAKIDESIQHHIEMQIKTLGNSKVSTTPELVTRFDTRFLNVSGRFSAERIVESLSRTKRGTALFTGMPGTGKTQLAAHMAERCNMELLYRTAADINSKWYGESEQNVAALFEDCDTNNQMIFLDEADTLLLARSEDSHRVDRAVTSEFLRRLEAFNGIFMCATNHGDLLDPALMRRFVFRLDFEPLNLHQRILMLKELTGIAEMEALDSCVQQRLTRLERLTPGDFANCKKRLICLDNNATVSEWIDELEQEHNVKPQVRGKLGFM